MLRKAFTAVRTATTVGLVMVSGAALAADRSVTEAGVGQRIVKRIAVRPMLRAGLPRAHYSYRTTIIAGPPVPYDARPFAYGRYPWAPYTNSYGIPARV